MARFALVDDRGRIFQTGPMADAGTMYLFANDPDYALHVIAETDEPVADNTHYWDGSRFSPYPEKPGDWAEWDGVKWTDPRTPADYQARLSAQRISSIAAVNEATARWRAARATAIWGQDALYQIKEAAGIALLSGASLSPIQQMALDQEVGITAPTVEQVAQVYVSQGELLRATLVAFEALRMPTILQIETAPDIEGVLAAEAWFLANLPT